MHGNRFQRISISFGVSVSITEFPLRIYSSLPISHREGFCKVLHFTLLLCWKVFIEPNVLVLRVQCHTKYRTGTYCTLRKDRSLWLLN